MKSFENPALLKRILSKLIRFANSLFPGSLRISGVTINLVKYKILKNMSSSLNAMRFDEFLKIQALNVTSFLKVQNSKFL